MALKVYQVAFQMELTSEALAMLRQVSQKRIQERLASLLKEGRLTVSQVQRQYGALMGSGCPSTTILR